MSNLNKNTIYQINSISKQLHSFDAIHKSILNPISESLSSIKSLTSSAEYITSSPSLKLKTASDLIESFHSLSSIAASNFRPFSEALDSFRSFNSFANIQSSIATLNLNPVSETLDSLRSINSFANIQSSIAALNLNPISEALDSFRSINSFHNVKSFISDLKLNPISEALNSLHSITSSFACVYEKNFNPISESLNYIKSINCLTNTIDNIENSFSSISKLAITRLEQINIANFKSMDNSLYKFSNKIFKNINHLQEMDSMFLDDSDFYITHTSLNSLYYSLNNIDNYEESAIDTESYTCEINTLNKFLISSKLKKLDFHIWLPIIGWIITTFISLIPLFKDADYSQIVNPIKSIDSHITDKMDTIIQNQLELKESIDETNTKLDKVLEDKE